MGKAFEVPGHTMVWDSLVFRGPVRPRNDPGLTARSLPIKLLETTPSQYHRALGNGRYLAVVRGAVEAKPRPLLVTVHEKCDTRTLLRKARVSKRQLLGKSLRCRTSNVV